MKILYINRPGDRHIPERNYFCYLPLYPVLEILIYSESLIKEIRSLALLSGYHLHSDIVKREREYGIYYVMGISLCSEEECKVFYDLCAKVLDI